MATKEKTFNFKDPAVYAWVILAVVYLASVTAPFNQYKVPPIMPIMMETFHLDLAQAGLLMSSIAGVGLLLSIPAGLILQRLGSKATVLIALGWIAAGAAMGALAENFGLLLVSRLFEGAGMGMMGVAAPATIAMWFPQERQGTPMGIWATWVPVGSVVINNLAPAAAPVLGWQAVWWIGAGFAVLMILLSGLLIVQPPEQAGSSGAGRDAPNLGKVFANPSLWLLAGSFACFNLAFGALATYYPTFLNQVRGFSLPDAALVTSITTVLFLFFAPAAGWLSDKIGSRRLVFSLPFLGMALFLIFPFHVTGWQVAALMAVQGILLAAVPTATFAAVSEVMPRPEWAGLGLAAIMVGQNLGQLVGPILFGELVETLDWATAGYLMIPFCLLGFVLAWKVRIR